MAHKKNHPNRKDSSPKAPKSKVPELERQLDKALEAAIRLRLENGEVSGVSLAEIVPEFRVDNGVKHRYVAATLTRLIEEGVVNRYETGGENDRVRTVYRLGKRA